MKIKQSINRAVVCAAVSGLAGWCLPAIAQDNDAVDTGEPAPTAGPNAQRPPMDFSLGYAHQFNANLDNGGNFSINRVRAGIGLPVRINDQFALVGKFSYQRDQYNFGGNINGWNDINTLTAVGLLQYRIDQKWMVYGGPILRIAGERSDWNNATKGGGAIAVNYVVNDKLSIGGGIVAMAGIAEDAKLLPILTANWKFAEDWSLKLGMTDLATAGYGVTVGWDFHPEWQLGFGAQMHKSRFRIEGTGVTTGGVGQESSLTVTTSLTWNPDQMKTFSATAFAGIAAGGKLEVDTANGNAIRDEHYDAVPVLGVKAGLKF